MGQPEIRQERGNTERPVVADHMVANISRYITHGIWHAFK